MRQPLNATRRQEATAAADLLVSGRGAAKKGRGDGSQEGNAPRGKPVSRRDRHSCFRAYRVSWRGASSSDPERVATHSLQLPSHFSTPSARPPS